MTGVRAPRGHPVTYGSPRASIGHVVSRGIDRVSSGRAGVASVTDLTTRREPERQDLDHSPPAAGRERQPPDPPSSASGGVQLGRLLVLARLTAAQALQIGADVLAAAAVGAAPGSSGPGNDEVVVGPVVTADGRVVPGPSANGERAGGTSATGTTMRPASQVLADVAAAALLPGPAADPAADQRLAELDLAVQDLPAAGLPVVARRLQEAAAAIDRTAVHADLAALVRAVGGAGGSPNGVAPTGKLPTPVRAGTGEPAPGRSGSAGRPSPRGWPRSWSSPRSSSRKSSCCATTSPPTSTCSWTPDGARTSRPPRRSPTVPSSRRRPPPRPGAWPTRPAIATGPSRCFHRRCTIRRNGRLRRAPRRVVRPGRPIGHARRALFPVALRPPGGRRPRDLEPLGGPGDRPVVVNGGTYQPEPAGLGQRRITVDHEGPPGV